MWRFVLPGTYDPLFTLEDPSSVASYVPLWGTEGLDSLEHGHVTRFDKICRITESDLAMRRLRVCWERRHAIYNCGRCVKCMRTRVHLKLAGAVGRCETLPTRLSLEEIRRAEPESPLHLNYIDENIAEAESRGMLELAAALSVQRERSVQAVGGRRGAREQAAGFLNRMRRSYRKRRFDAWLRRLKRRHGFEHLFTWVGSGSPEMRR